MNYYNLLSQQLFPIVLACVVSTFAVMALVAYCSHYVHRERPIIGAKPDKVEDVELAEQQDDDRALSEKKNVNINEYLVVITANTYYFLLST